MGKYMVVHQLVLLFVDIKIRMFHYDGNFHSIYSVGSVKPNGAPCIVLQLCNIIEFLGTITAVSGNPEVGIRPC